jgi:NAD(P)-dependent dehydrogenase (short-subunit alcohol dehydrogenase family)
MDIKNQVVVISGGGSGMGAETGQYLANLGAKIAILDQNVAAAQKIAASFDGLAVKCDVTQSNEAEIALQKVYQELGPPRICVNCAGIAPAKRIINKEGPLSLEEFSKVITINLIGTFNILRLAAAIMSVLAPIGDSEERGVIINTASIAAYEGQIGQAAYSASKGGVCALTLPAARELSQFNIRVMTIAPGLIKTPLLEGLPENVREGLVANVPFPKRFGYPKEFAMLVEHIIKNPLLNGEIIRLDGALRMPIK